MLKDIITRIVGNNDNPLRKGGKRNYVFIHINKTGGTSIAEVIGLSKKKHLTVKQLVRLINSNEWESAYKFAFVRNPWDKVVSHYKYRVKTNQCNMLNSPIGFNEWVECTYGNKKDYYYYDNPIMFQSQLDWLKNNEELIDVDFIGKFERIVDDFKIVANNIGLENCDLPHLNKTKKVNYRDYYNDNTAGIIERHFKEDIMKFGYEY
ncbi:sulfotransferase family 2 domain-containing protein [Limibacter armeniacum]|uniref:sulfotransferase family 2 domain-containing protein n=1 Tax=Limibacter armeniacum TaxID=466084 RepID=UPI002FE654B5